MGGPPGCPQPGRFAVIRLSLRMIGVLAITALMSIGGSAAVLAAEPTFVSGPFTSVTVPPPACHSPVGICTLGHLTGDLDASYAFTIFTFVPHPGLANVFDYTGDSTITMTHGGAVLRSHDTGMMDTTNPAAVPFETTVFIYSGTRDFAGATGTLVAFGKLSFITGQASGHYVGWIARGGGQLERDN